MPWMQKRRISPPSDKKERVKRHNEKWNHYYGSVAWKHLRDYYMSLHPLCKDCAIEGRSCPSEECHHSTPWDWWSDSEDKWKALLCVDLLVPLCKKHHLERHKYLHKPDNFEQTKVYKMIHDS